MKHIALIVCAAALFVAGCSSDCCHKKAAASCPTAQPSCSATKTCSMPCCVEAKATCATCPKCSKK